MNARNAGIPLPWQDRTGSDDPMGGGGVEATDKARKP